MAGFWKRLVESFNENLRNKYQGTSGKEDVIGQKIEKGKTVNIANPTSMRTFTKGDDGTFASGKVLIGNKQQNFGHFDKELETRTAKRTSSAIKEIKYDPAKERAYVDFTNGKHSYEYKVKPNEFNDFLNAPSKGQHVVNLWNHNPHFRAPGY